ncbi:hypothetical protein LGL55_19535 [Clostridium tagluense]|uniref:hypothetical protein n=1 Tax=Clostridium tagluense TaxID=360422 RepID=UPI001C0CA63A|nr:hypothetical protein [Clostridium tagluense]MBU3129931.1 hypothetical protein [Clostridium tagluense]MCB2311946.1 hypothetical protein [Clostridium tagluense]MCB2318143.1 hypothetical protein [Clostridium tagluense]MCB2323320.1 hypothetical protein [Clostridium tagluense]MCB2327927.1 hypothetical protein [Clostridium tagluense]
MVAWERLGSNMGFLKILIVFLVAIFVLSLIIQYLIKTNRIKPSKVSRLFHDNDESFIKSWKKVKEKGILRYTIKIVIRYTIMMGIMGIVFILNKLSVYGYEQSQTVFVALIIGAIFGLINSLIGWVINSYRYSILKNFKC